MTQQIDEMLPEVTDKTTAVANVFVYNDALNTLESKRTRVQGDTLRTITMARAWFAVKKQGQWYLAPAKFAGFEGMTPELYAEYRQEISGTRGEAALKKFTGNNPVEQTHPAFLALMALAARFDRKPNSLCYVYVLHEEAEAEKEVALPLQVAAAVEAVVALAANLPPEGVAALKRRIAAL